MTSNLEWLQTFYLSLCNGEWEHDYGFKIENCDNPGWLFEFEMTDTGFEKADFPDVRLGNDSTGDGPDWVHLHKRGDTIEGACGPLQLDALLGEFRTWVERQHAERLGSAND